MSNNTARHLYLLVNKTEPERAIAPPAMPRRFSGIGLASAVVISLMLWALLFSLGSQIFAAIIG